MDGKVFARMQGSDAAPRLHAEEPQPRAQPADGAVPEQPGGVPPQRRRRLRVLGRRVVEVDGFNPQLAARLARALDRWRAWPSPTAARPQRRCKRVAARAELSTDVREIVTRRWRTDADNPPQS
jgi:aminopeptidase N